MGGCYFTVESEAVMPEVVTADAVAAAANREMIVAVEVAAGLTTKVAAMIQEAGFYRHEAEAVADLGWRDLRVSYSRIRAKPFVSWID